MKKITVRITAVVAVCGVVGCTQYDRWFTYPALRAHVNMQMKDPASTQYRNEFMTKSGWLCGEMNSKNGMGGYAGFRRFIAGSADDAYIEGYGYVGKEVGTARIVEHLTTKTAIIRSRVELQNSSGVDMRLSDSEIDAMATKEIFEKRWRQICQ